MIHEAFRYEVTGEPDAAMSGLSGSEGAGRKRTPVREQRAVLRPYLHEVLDEWYEHDIRPLMRGRTFLLRFADDGAPRRRGEEAAMVTSP